MVIPQSLHCHIDFGGTTTCVTSTYGVGYISTLGAGIAGALARGKLKPCTNMGAVPEHWPGTHIGRDTPLTACSSI